MSGPQSRLAGGKTPAVIGAILIAAIGMVIAATRHRAEEAQRAREESLRRTLTSIRVALAAYRTHHGHSPATLSDLAGSELAQIPADPMTGSNATWKTTMEESVRADDFQASATAPPPPHIVDVRSGASGRDSNGRPFSEY